MSYRCIKELKVVTTTILVGTVVDGCGRDDFADKAYVTFAIGDYHYAVYLDTFREHFEEVES